MNIDISSFDCCGCEACCSTCPKRAITMRFGKDGFRYPVINEKECISCGLCIKKCPILNSTQCHPQKESVVFGGYTLDSNVRAQSSSGGLFSVLATEIIRRGGVVFGAVLNDSISCEHAYTETAEGLKVFLGSKYVQSFIGNSYCVCRNFLQANRLVLFSGTPCQIAGLHSFLGTKYDNLICVDFICHGVPSPQLWNKYIEEKRIKYNSPVDSVSFRKKETGWKMFSMAIRFQDNKTYSADLKHDLWLKTFLQNAMLRNSCYNCMFRGINRYSDITIGDFWGIDAFYPDWFDNKGISLLLTHTEKGEKFFNSLMDKTTVFQPDIRKALHNNPAYYKSPAKPLYRNRFIQHALSHTIQSAYLLYVFPRVSFTRILQAIYGFSRRIFGEKIVKSIKNKVTGCS